MIFHFYFEMQSTFKYLASKLLKPTNILTLEPRNMENQKKITRSLLLVALATLLLLSIPLIAMQFTNEVDWSFADFIIMGLLIFGTGSSYVLITRFATNLIYRAAIAQVLGTTLFMIWANLAVGLIGSGPNAGNLLYMGVITVVIVGSIRARFSAVGMERAMYMTSFSLVLVAVIGLLTNMDEYPGSSIKEIIAINAFFAILYAVAGSLFHFATPPAPEKYVG